MTKNENSSTSSIESMAQQVTDGTMSESQRKELMRWMEKDKASHDQFIDHMVLHALLRREFGSYDPEVLQPPLEKSPSSNCPTPKQPLAPNLAEQPSGMWSTSTLSAVSVTGWAVAILLGVALWSWSNSQENQGEKIVDSRPTLSVQPVAYLVSSQGYAWDSQGAFRPRENDRPLQEGQQFTLMEGNAEFRMASGVTLNVEGPASIVFHSPLSLSLEYGRLTFYVPESVSEEFLVNTRGISMTASDAECGVDVRFTRLRFHTFSGQALVTHEGTSSVTRPLGAPPQENIPPKYPKVTYFADTRLPDFSCTQVTAGKGIHFKYFENGKGDWASGYWVSADRERFATEMFMANNLPIGDDYVTQVLASKPFGYWRFESIEGQNIRNEIQGGTDLRVMGTVPLRGDSMNLVAELGHPGILSALTSDGPIQLARGGDYSFELWMKPRYSHRGTIASLLAEPLIASEGRYAFSIDFSSEEPRANQPDLIRVRASYPPFSRKRRSLKSHCLSNVNYLTRRWQHLVVVREKKSIQVYLDSRIVGKGIDRGHLVENLHLLIGQRRHKDIYAPYAGQLDEVAIYDRALSKQEIEKHFHSVVWRNRPDSESEETSEISIPSR